MKKTINILFMVIMSAMVALALHCGPDQAEAEGTKGESNDLAILTEWMSGSFSSQEQSESDSTYFDIRLHMVPIWRERSDAHWFYVEQAAADYQDQPYRQRVYRVSRTGKNKFESAVYTLEEPLRFAGAWNKDNPLEELNPDSLSLREGCSIILYKEGDAFVGSTVDKNCRNDLRGASYVTSEVVIREDGMVSWDRGLS